MGYNPRDHYFKKAKSGNFAARSIFKLEELDKKFKIFRRGDTVVDLGAAPGSWSQYVSKVIGKDGKILGLDLQEIKITLPNAVFVQANALEVDLEKLAHEHQISFPLDALISDMAPKTTGVRITDQSRSLELCEMALHLAQEWVKPGGNFVCKLFHGAEFEDFRAQMREQYRKVELLKPKSTRKESKEIFLVGLGKR